MNFTRHTQERLRRRNIRARHVEAALSKGREVWRKGALLIMHGTLRVIYCPFSNCVITAWWQGKKPTRTGRCRVKQISTHRRAKP